jgi:Mrp family chromosome partitioning ATPase
MPTNLELLEKANRAAQLFRHNSPRRSSGSSGQLVPLPPAPATSAVALPTTGSPRITFRFQPQFLDLANQLLAPKAPGQSFSIGICPARGQDPIGRFVAFFASSLSQMAKSPILLIETDFHRPSLGRHLGAASAPGLRDLLAYTGRAGLECIHATRYENLHLLPAGSAAGTKAPRNLQKGLDRLYRLVSEKYQSIIVAYPAWNEIPSLHPCYALADAMLLAVRPGSCTAMALRRTVRRLRSERANLIGSVLSSIEP